MRNEEIDNRQRAIHRLQSEINASWVQIGKHGDSRTSDGKMLSARTREREEELLRVFRELEELL